MGGKKRIIIFIGFIILLMILVIFGEIKEKRDEKKRLNINIQECVEDKLQHMLSKMKETDQVIEHNGYVIALEKVYYDVCTGDGSFIISVKNNSDMSIEENSECQADSSSGTLYFDKADDGEWNLALRITGNVLKHEVIDNIIYITAYIDVAASKTSLYTGEWQIAYLSSLKDDYEIERGMGFVLPNTSEAREIRINEDKRIFISDYSILVRNESIEDLILYLKDGSKLKLYKDKQAIYDHALFDYGDGDGKISFNKVIDKEKIKYVKLNGKKYD